MMIFCSPATFLCPRPKLTAPCPPADCSMRAILSKNSGSLVDVKWSNGMLLSLCRTPMQRTDFWYKRLWQGGSYEQLVVDAKAVFNYCLPMWKEMKKGSKRAPSGPAGPSRGLQTAASQQAPVFGQAGLGPWRSNAGGAGRSRSGEQPGAAALVSGNRGAGDRSTQLLAPGGSGRMAPPGLEPKATGQKRRRNEADNQPGEAASSRAAAAPSSLACCSTGPAGKHSTGRAALPLSNPPHSSTLEDGEIVGNA